MDGLKTDNTNDCFMKAYGNAAGTDAKKGGSVSAVFFYHLKRIAAFLISFAFLVTAPSEKAYAVTILDTTKYEKDTENYIVSKWESNSDYGTLLPGGDWCAEAQEVLDRFFDDRDANKGKDIGSDSDSIYVDRILNGQGHAILCQFIGFRIPGGDILDDIKKPKKTKTYIQTGDDGEEKSISDVKNYDIYSLYADYSHDFWVSNPGGWNDIGYNSVYYTAFESERSGRIFFGGEADMKEKIKEDTEYYNGLSELTLEEITGTDYVELKWWDIGNAADQDTEYITVVYKNFPEYPGFYFRMESRIDWKIYCKQDAKTDSVKDNAIFDIRDRGASDFRNYMLTIENTFLNMEPIAYISKIASRDLDVNETAHTTEAKNDKDDINVPIPLIIGAGITGAGAAAAAIVKLSSGKKTGKEDDEQRKKRYRLVIKKDFYDSIKRGAPGKEVYAKIVETGSDGSEHDRPDLAALISVSADDGVAAVSGVTVTDGWRGALVSVPNENETAEKCTVKFRLDTETGAHTEAVVFKVVGDPVIEFIEKDRLATHFELPGLICDSGPYETLIRAKYFVKEPEVTCESMDSGKVRVTAEKTTEPFVFRLKAECSSKRTVNTVNNALNEPRQKTVICVKAKNDEESAEGSFTVVLYPEGISAEAASSRDNRVVIPTAYEDAAGKFLDAKIKPARFDLVCAYKDAEGKVKLQTDGIVPAEKLSGDNGYGEKMLCAFEYSINMDRSREGIFAIEPATHVVEDDRYHYELKLPVSCTAGNGNTYEGMIGFRVTGELFNSADKLEREREKKGLRRLVAAVGLDANGKAADMIRNFDKIPTAELRLIREEVFNEAVEYYTKEASEMNTLADKMDKTVTYLGTAKWLGDQAFSFLMKKWAGPQLEPVLSPLKDIIVDYYAEVFTAWCWGYTPEPMTAAKFFSSFEQIFENAVIAYITGDAKPDPQQIGMWICMIAMMNYIRHYSETDPRSITEALMQTVKDISVNAAKVYLGGKIKSMYEKYPQIREYIENKAITWLKLPSDPVAAMKQLRLLCDSMLDAAADLSANSSVETVSDQTYNVFKGKWGDLGKVSITFAGESYQVPLYNILGYLIDNIIAVFDFAAHAVETYTSDYISFMKSEHVTYSTKEEVEVITGRKY